MPNLAKIIMATIFFCIISGCAVTSTYVSSIGLRNQYATVASHEGAEKTIDIYESKMEADGGPCFAFMPYKSLIQSQSSRLIEQRVYSKGGIPFDKQYRKWYGYPAQVLQVIAVPVDIVFTGVVGVGLLVAAPIYAIHGAISPHKAEKSNKSSKPTPHSGAA
ncbi:MAG: hypothetical protein PSX71_09010 [bacterium]|nr:hypothetical protein [bacterium]